VTLNKWSRLRRSEEGGLVAADEVARAGRESFAAMTVFSWASRIAK
jgi:hypothetical protein